MPHAWRRRGRNTDTVKQRGRDGARLRQSPSHPGKKREHVTCHMPPVSAAAALEARWQRVGKHNLPHVDPTSFCRRVSAPSYSLKANHAHSFVSAERRRVTYQSCITQRSGRDVSYRETSPGWRTPTLGPKTLICTQAHDGTAAVKSLFVAVVVFFLLLKW